MLAGVVRVRPHERVAAPCAGTLRIHWGQLTRKAGTAQGRRVVLLEFEGYSLQVNKKSKEGKSQHADRDAQFRYINGQSTAYMDRGWPVISVDSKKRELVGNFKNAGRSYRPKGDPELVNAYDFRTEAEGIALPYGCYDPKRNEGFVNVGVSADHG